MKPYLISHQRNCSVRLNEASCRQKVSYRRQGRSKLQEASSDDAPFVKALLPLTVTFNSNHVSLIGNIYRRHRCACLDHQRTNRPSTDRNMVDEIKQGLHWAGEWPDSPHMDFHLSCC